MTLNVEKKTVDSFISTRGLLLTVYYSLAFLFYLITVIVKQTMLTTSGLKILTSS